MISDKKKVLVICDHPLSTSGVGIQARYLLNGLAATGKYTFRVFGAAIKHTDYRTAKVGDDIIIQPIDGFGNRDLLRVTLANERPDVLLLFTDPRFFIYVWEMEDEIHQVCPIAYWHVWDNDPYPAYNKPLYESTDLVNCLSHKTYEILKPNFPDRVNYIPHSLPKEIFRPLSRGEVRQARQAVLGPERADHFIALWVNRNARRKMPSDVIDSWRIFLDDLQARHGHRKASLIMHTDPLDQEGPNLIHVVEMLGVRDSVVFSTERVDFERMNAIHNMADCCINISCNEGFGLGTLEALYCGKPIVALKTGGLTRQVVDHRTGQEYGVGLDPDVRDLVGSQMVPYIFEDHINNNRVAEALMRLYEMGSEARAELGAAGMRYAHEEFDMQRMVSEWDRTLTELANRPRARPWEVRSI